MTAKYTFLLPAYKTRFLREALNSIQNQTFQNYKVVISDDCSPEDVYGVCGSFLADSRFIYRKNDRNIGAERLVDHWNLLVNFCDTEYLIMASDDDVYAPTFLEEVDRLTESYPTCDLFRSKANEIDSNGDILYSDGLFPEKVEYLDFIVERYSLPYIACIANFVFRTKRLKEKGGFVSFPFAWYSDTATVIMMAENGCANTKKELFSFRVSDISISYGKTSSHMATKKVSAVLLYDDWINNILTNLSKTEDKKIKRKIGFIFSVQSRDNVMMIGKEIYECDFFNFRRLCKEIKCRHISTVAFQYNYYKRIMLRLFGKK